MNAPLNFGERGLGASATPNQCITIGYALVLAHIPTTVNDAVIGSSAA